MSGSKPAKQSAAIRNMVAAAAASTGRPGREIAARLDLLTATGPRYVVARLLEEQRLRRQEDGFDMAYYDRLWAGAARDLGATVLKRRSGILEIALASRRTRVYRQWVPLDDVVTVRASLDKVLVNELIASAGVPATEFVECELGSLAAARDLLRRSTAVVVKPACGTGAGMGTTAGVVSDAQLSRAAVLAARRSAKILVERQVPGSVYRLLFLDGELIDVVRRDPPHVTGDGRSSIRELILKENVERLRADGDRGLQLITVTLDCVFALGVQGLSLTSIPAPGLRVRVRSATNQSGPQGNHTVAEPLADTLVDEARSIVAALGLRLAGVDIITPDTSRSLADAGGAAIEVNGGPGLHHHYLVSCPQQATHVCVPILRRALGQA